MPKIIVSVHPDNTEHYCIHVVDDLGIASQVEVNLDAEKTVERILKLLYKVNVDSIEIPPSLLLKMSVWY